jgi:hypothetical protein
MLTATALPGASYATTTFTIPWTALTTITTNDTVAVDSFERMMFNLLMAVYEKQEAGTFTQTNLGMEISNVSLSRGSWETATNTFSDRTVHSFLVSFDCGSSTAALLTDGDTVSSV